MTQRRSGSRSELLATGILVTATAVLVAQFLSVTQTVVAVGNESMRLGTHGWQFGLWDGAVIAVAGCAAGASATMLLVGTDWTSATAPDTEPLYSST